MLLARGRAADRLTLALGGWILSCGLFLVIGVLTPVDMRHYLAAIPAIAIAAGSGAAWAWHDGWPRHRILWRLAAAFSCGLVLWLGGVLWRGAGGVRAALGAFAVSSIVLVGHQGSYNDATFVTSF